MHDDVIVRKIPNRCFSRARDVDGSTFSKMRDFVELALKDKERLRHSFIECQKMIPDKIGVGVHGVNEFFKWYKEQDLTRGRSGRNVAAYRDLYNKLPFPIAKYLDKFYSIVGIKLHGGSPILPRTRKQWKPRQEDLK